jgi:hypothetical protein
MVSPGVFPHVLNVSDTGRCNMWCYRQKNKRQRMGNNNGVSVHEVYNDAMVRHGSECLATFKLKLTE